MTKQRATASQRCTWRASCVWTSAMSSNIEDQEDSLFADPGAGLSISYGHVYAHITAWPGGSIRHKYPTVEPIHTFTRLDGTQMKLYYAWVEISTDGYERTTMDATHLRALLEVLEGTASD